MAEKIITLTIEKLAGLGDGAGLFEGQRVFVPYTLPGDIVQARVARETKDASYAELEKIIAPGEGRTAPVCRHFADCGGCTLQHLGGEAYREFKQQMAREAVRKAGFDADRVEPIIILPAASRRRVELKVENGKLGYYAQHSHRLVDIEECKVLEPALEALILRLKPQLDALPGLSSVQVNGGDEGYDVVLEGKNSDSWRLREDKDIRRATAQGRILCQSGPVTVTLGDVKVDVPPGAFLQASREAQSLMTRRVLEAVGESKKLLDLFAGVGTYSFPLSARAEVMAVEGDKAMVEAMEQAAVQHKLGRRFKATRQDLFSNPVKIFAGFDAVIINPPRQGAKEQVKHLAASAVKKLVMISCNPATFTRDARMLQEGGYKLKKVLPIDQFVYTSHLEIIAEFAN